MITNSPDVFVNPYTDFGFKYLFGTEFNKEFLISFLNALLKGEQEIKDLTYLKTEQFGDNALERVQVFDVYCENERGERFIVEMQNMTQEFFKDRTIYYATTPIRQQAERGKKWDYHLKGVYTIGILNFTFDFKDDNYYHHEVKLMDTKTHEVFYDKLTFIYLEMPKFKKTEEELEGMFDKWLFVLKNLSRLLDRPAALQERIFTRLFEQAKIANFNEQDRLDYDESWKVYLDNYNTLKYALTTARKEAQAKGMAEGRAKGLAEGRAEGIAEGRVEGRAEGMVEGERKKSMEIARNLKSSGMATSFISEVTGLSEEEIQAL